MSRTSFPFSLLLLSIVPSLLMSAPLESPDRQVSFETTLDVSGRVLCSIRRHGAIVVAPSAVGLDVGGYAYGRVCVLGMRSVPEPGEVRFPWRGNKTEVAARWNAARIPVQETRTRETWFIEARCFDDGVAYRYVIPGRGVRVVTADHTQWTLPDGTVAWCNPNTSNYEGVHERWPVAQIPRERFPEGIGMPVTLELPNGGYAAITEADTMHFSGATAEPTGGAALAVSFRDDPEGWAMNGEIVTPWRVVMLADDLDGLVNCDIVPAVCPPPDAKLFPAGADAAWLKPGRCLWQWWAYDDPGTHWSRQHQLVDSAAAIGASYYLVDEGWEHPRQEWATDGRTPWDRLKELCDYAAARGVGIWVWRSWKDDPEKLRPGVQTPEKREEFFRRCAAAGVKGVKIDFMESESHDRLAFYRDCLRLGAEWKIMVNFHGANKPAGEPRTWPNELSREGVRGLEHNKWDTLAPSHYATLPFTRFLAGHGDFTPTTLQADFLKGTTVAQQLAGAIVFTSPILCWADKPELYLACPAIDLIRTLPTVWDETRVLAGSRIGELAVFARRSGQDWYVAALNGGAARDYTPDLSFLRGAYRADSFCDQPGDPLGFEVRRAVPVDAKTKLTLRLSAGGGFVVRLKPATTP